MKACNKHPISCEMCFSGLCLRFSYLTVTDGHFEVLKLINSALKVMSIATSRVAYDTQIQDDKAP